MFILEYFKYEIVLTVENWTLWMYVVFMEHDIPIIIPFIEIFFGKITKEKVIV